MMGGHSALKTDEAGLQTIAGYQGIIEAHLGQTWETFEPIAYTSQVVAGTVYQAKIRVDGGDIVHAKIFKPLPHTNEAESVMDANVGNDEADAFHF